jgi:hypothetical protein
MEMIVAAAVIWTFHHFFHRHIAHFVRASPVYVKAACLIAFLIAVAVGADSGTGKFIYFEF